MNELKYMLLGLLAVIGVGLTSCSKSASRDERLNSLISRSPVIFLCEPTDGNFLIKKIYRAEPSWGSEIRAGEKVAIRINSPDGREKSFVVLRGAQQYLGSDLNQSQIPIGHDGNLEYFNISLAAFERRVALLEFPKEKP